MYDFTHCICDALEGISHSLCTLEFEDHRPLYDWVLENININAVYIETYSDTSVESKINENSGLFLLMENVLFSISIALSSLALFALNMR